MAPNPGRHTEAPLDYFDVNLDIGGEINSDDLPRLFAEIDRVLDAAEVPRTQAGRGPGLRTDRV